VRSRRVISLGVVVLASLLSACGADAGEEPGPESGDGAPVVGTAPQAPIELAAEPFQPSEAALVLMEEATVAVRQDGEWSVTLLIDLPEGGIATVTYTLDPEPRELPGLSSVDNPLEGYSFQSERSGDGLLWRIHYIVPVAEFPPDVFAASRSEGPSTWVGHVVRTLSNPRVASASDGPGIAVAVEGFMAEVDLEVIARTLGADEAATMDAVLNLVTALDASAHHRQALQRLARLRACVEQPGSSPAAQLRQREYQDNPTAKQNDLTAIRNAELDITANTGARFAGVLTGQASGLVRWLGFVVGPVTAWADARAAYYIEETLRELERRITGCDEEEERDYWAFVGSYRSPYGGRPLLPVGGIACGDPETGPWVFYSSGAPESVATAETLRRMIDEAHPRHPIPIAPMGVAVEIVGESGFDGRYQLIPGNPAHVVLTVTNKYRGGALVDRRVYEVFRLEAAPDRCARAR
jgi:hypothetical protein